MLRFKVSSHLTRAYRHRRLAFGYNGLGEIAYQRTYSRLDHQTGRKESWFDSVNRVVRGAFEIEARHLESNNISIKPQIQQRNLDRMFKSLFNMKFLPSGRGLYSMGTPLIHEHQEYAALNNCAFVSTSKLADNPNKPFSFAMDALLLGVGVGFDVSGAGSLRIQHPRGQCSHTIADSRRGWTRSVEVLLDSYLLAAKPRPIFDYSKIRAKGKPLRTFGGTAGGPEPLRNLHHHIDTIFGSREGTKITIRDIADVFNLIGRFTVETSSRRSAQIALGPYNDEFMSLKNYELHPERADYGWASNNSVVGCDLDYSRIADQAAINGEPGVFWLQTARDYGRLGDEPTGADYQASGVNPCGEQTLWSYEMCNLAEVFLNRVSSIDDYTEALSHAYHYAKIVSLCINGSDETQKVMSRNHRIGISLSGVHQFIASKGLTDLVNYMEVGYKYLRDLDRKYSRYLKVPESIKLTTIKPSGTISLLAGATAGIHASIGGQYYIRRVQLREDDPISTTVAKAGYPVKVSKYFPATVNVEIPNRNMNNITTQASQSIAQQFDMAALAQRHWSDNQVSCTVDFDPTQVAQLAESLDNYQNKLKSISMLPRSQTAYQEMPHQDIDATEYYKRVQKLQPIDWTAQRVTPRPEKYCSNDTCLL